VIVAVAVTDTLAAPGTGDGRVDPGKPQPWAAEYVRRLKAAGNHVVIHDPIANDARGHMILVMWLRDNGIDAYDDVWLAPGKPHADRYIDGRSEVPDVSGM
jgi:hypothetical protein